MLFFLFQEMDRDRFLHLQKISMGLIGREIILLGLQVAHMRQGQQFLLETLLQKILRLLRQPRIIRLQSIRHMLLEGITAIQMQPGRKLLPYAHLVQLHIKMDRRRLKRKRWYTTEPARIIPILRMDITSRVGQILQLQPLRIMPVAQTLQMSRQTKQYMLFGRRFRIP